MLELKRPESLPWSKEDIEFQFFLQMMVNRKLVGGIRYGAIQKRQKYMTRLEKELKAYKKTGNSEQLINIAVYAFLESFAPENKKFHFDANAKSVTRKEE